MLIAKCYLDLLVSGDMFKLLLINGVLKVDYSKLSDFEINKLVARAIDGISVNDSTTAIDCYLSANNSNSVKWYKVDFCDPSEFELFNPCNNPSDVRPIILDYGIETSPLFSGKWRASQVASYTFGEDAIYGFEFVDENPLRAAMIVFLMMQDGKK
jgi:hypothetical protein